jgi:hypothetical protein
VPFAAWAVLEDHFSPLLLVLAPLAQFSWSSYLLVVVQAVAVAISIPIAWRMADRVSSSRRRTWLLTLAYAFSPVLLFAVFFDIHASVLATPLLLLVFDGVDRSRPNQILLAGTAAALLREDIAFFMVFFAIIFFRDSRRTMIWLGAISAATLAIGRVVAAGRDPGTEPPHINFSYDYIDPLDPIGTASGAIDALFIAGAGSLLLVLVAIAVPWIGFGKLEWKATLFGTVAAAPFLLSQYVVTKSVSSHYYFALAPILFWAVLRGSNESTAEPGTGLRQRLTVIGISIALLGGPLMTGAFADGKPTAMRVLDAAMSDRVRIAQAHDVLACVPDEFTIAVGPEMTPHVADHAFTWQWPQPIDTAVWLLGGNRFVLQPSDTVGRPDAIVFARSSYDPIEYGYRALSVPRESGIEVFLRDGLDGSVLADCLSSIP